MRFATPLRRGRLIQRYKRFLADVELEDGRLVTAHCANPGSLLGAYEPGCEVWLSDAAGPGRKLDFAWQLIRIGDTLVGINTGHPNRLVAEAIAQGGIPELAGYARLRREVRYGRNSRVDLLLEHPERPPCFVEIKNVTMRRNPGAGAPVEFPDSVTERGRKHLGELADQARRGARAVLFFLAQRQDCEYCVVAADIDPAYAVALGVAVAAGVEILCYRCAVREEGIEISDRIPFVMP